MKTTMNFLLLALLTLAPLMGSAQSTEYIVDESSTMVITGTSTIHDWEADVEEFNLDVSLDPTLLEKEPLEVPVSALALTVPVNAIESGKGGMNRRINGALKEKDHPQIMFNMTSVELADTVQSAESFTLILKGNLNVAGFEKEVSFPVTGAKIDVANYRFEGSYGINMKDYEVDPPSAMLGTIRSGEEVEIIFDILLTATQS